MTRIVMAAMLLAACAREKPPAPAGTSEPAAPADTMVLSAPGGRTIWLTAGRTATDSSGASCRERGIEIRSSDDTVRVPLLYTGDIPTVVNDSTIEARLWLHCVAGDPHRVNLRTGQPVRHKP
jgi:hypothetical protein